MNLVGHVDHRGKLLVAIFLGHADVFAQHFDFLGQLVQIRLGGVECRHRLLIFFHQRIALFLQGVAFGDQFVAHRFQFGQLIARGQLFLGQLRP